MLNKWKSILTNWINCFFNEPSKRDDCVNLESLLAIISHLHDNLNLDESKSSILEAHTIEDFILEKYPEFKFENGTIEATNQEEIYIVASLLLFFVCVISKDVNIKTAMCSKLSSEDQETILKFSKCLMEFSPITYKDVQMAITEACGQDIAVGGNLIGHVKVSETPPALRSLHSEVRRLQAALEAERFDRNYLQEELARTNLRLEKLVKDKEQYKLDIMNLKAKISLCCGQETEVSGGDAAGETSARLSRQLQETEERLVATQDQLEDVQYERDTYKAKIDELKRERDKWLLLSQQETTRAGQLADELEAERRHVQTLKELVTELRQYYQSNGLDGSQLECDDPDTSVHSLLNVSVCSEACANVVEVQLVEERAKIVALKQQIQMLQDQLNDLMQRTENEKKSLQGIISEKDIEILNLKHRINEEIDEKSKLKVQFNDEISKLNNEMNELEQKLKENHESSRIVIEQKMLDIQTLQEEKLSLLQSLSNETTKLENIITDLKIEIDTEKNLKLKMKEDYENHIMNLNDKVLNRNNQLVELQNDIVGKSEIIEDLHLKLRKEKESMEELSKTYNNDIAQLQHEKTSIENSFRQKTDEAKELQKRLQQHVAVFEEYNKEIDDLKLINSQLSQKYKALEECKASLSADIQKRDKIIDEIQKEMENTKNILSEEKNNFIRALDEGRVTINNLQMQLHDEIRYKTELFNELALLKQAKDNLSEEITMLNTEITQLKKDTHEKDRIIYATDLYLKEEKHISKTLKQECDTLKEEMKMKSGESVEKDKKVKALQEKIEYENKVFQEQLREKTEQFDSIEQKLALEVAKTNSLHNAMTTLEKVKHDEIIALQEKFDREISNLNEEIHKKDEFIGLTTASLQNAISEKNELHNVFSFLKAEKEEEIKSIQDKVEYINKFFEEQLRTRDCLIESINGNHVSEITERNSSQNTSPPLKIEKDSEIERILSKLEANSATFGEELRKKDKLLEVAREKLEIEISDRNTLLNSLTSLEIEKNNEIKAMQENLHRESEIFREELCLKDNIIENMTMKLTSETERKKSLEKALDSLEVEKENQIKTLQIKLESDSKIYEEKILKRDQLIESINDKLASEVIDMNNIKEEIKYLRNEKDELDRDLNKKRDEMLSLQADYEKLSQMTEQNNILIETLEQRLETENDKYAMLETNFDIQTSNLMAKLNETEKFVKEFNTKYRNTVEEKELTIQTCKIELEKLQKIVDNERNNIERLEREKEVLVQKLEEEMTYKNAIEKEYQNQCVALDTVTFKLNSEIALQSQEISTLKMEAETLVNCVEEKNEAIKTIEEKLAKEIQDARELTQLKDTEIREMNTKIEELTILAEEIEVELKKEISTKVQTIEALEKENEQLHFTIEDDNSNHEVMLKEKDKMVERLEEQLKTTTIQLESIRKDYEDDTLSWEKFKIDMKKHLEAKDNQIIQLREQIGELKNNLEQCLITTEKLKEGYERQIEDIIRNSNEADIKKKEEIVGLIAEVARNERQLADCEHENNTLKELLENEKAVRDSLENEKEKLMKDNEAILEELICEKSALIEEKTLLLNDKSILTQKLSEECSVRQIIEEEKRALLAEKNTLLEEKKCLAQQLVNEKSAKELITEEKEIINAAKELLEIKLVEEKMVTDSLQREKNELIQNKNEFIQEIDSLHRQLTDELLAKELLLKEQQRLGQMLDEEKVAKGEIFAEKQCLLDENELLKHNAIELRTVQEVLMNDKEILSVEKEGLLKSLSEEKAARDEMETEKRIVSGKLIELKEKYTLDLNEKQEELRNAVVELKHLKSDYKKHEDINMLIDSVVNSGLEKLLLNIKKEDICNEVLHKLVSVERNNIPINEKCDLIINIADTLTTELSLRKNLEKALEHENIALNEMKDMIKEKEMQVLEQQAEVKRLQQTIYENNLELSKQAELHNTAIELKVREMQKLHFENQSLNNELNDVKVQLEVKVHSLKEKLIDNENLTEKLKKTYECQIENLNLMVTKLTSYLKDKTTELELLRKEKKRLQQVIEGNAITIKSLEDEIKTQKQNHDKLISDFESERLVLKNMITVTESVMEDQKESLNKAISEHLKAQETLQEEKKALQEFIEVENKNTELKLQEKDIAFQAAFKEISQLKDEKENLLKTIEIEKEVLNKEIVILRSELDNVMSSIQTLETQNEELTNTVQKYKLDIASLEEKETAIKIKKDCLESELLTELDKLTTILKTEISKNEQLKCSLQEKLQTKVEIQDKVKVLTDEIIDLIKINCDLEQEKNDYASKLNEAKAESEIVQLKAKEEIDKLNKDNMHLINIIEEHKTVIANLEQLVKHELAQNQKLREDTAYEKLNLENKCSLLQEYQSKAEKQLEERDKDIDSVRSHCTQYWNSIVSTYQTNVEKLEQEIATLKAKYEHDVKEKNDVINKFIQEKDAVLKELTENKEKYQSELGVKTTAIYELKQKFEDAKNEAEMLEAIRKENEDMMRAVVQRETYAVISQDKISSQKYSAPPERDLGERHQVSTPTSDLTHSSLESFKTITDLEKIIHDKNRTITTLQSDIVYLKSLLADSENKLLDVTKELEMTKESCEQLSNQLKKMVNQKNEEISDLKKQVSKMCVTENRASQIIKVSAKYQAIILKRIAEIKSNTILKELTNFGNTANCDNDVRRSLNAGPITMEDLENFLETTDRHLKQCTEKQIALKKDRDRLIEVNRINESEIVNLKKFLTELSISFKTFGSVKELYIQKLSKVISIQRTVRREILNRDNLITDAVMCKLERGYAAALQDLCECTMNMERWVERSIARFISPEKIKQAFSSEEDRGSIASNNFQNTSLEVQLQELENTFQKLLEEVLQAQKGDGAKDPQAVTIMEVRAEYEDKLNRMKAKMKQLYQEQIMVFKEKQKEEIATLERELQKTREKLSESSRAYEQHIRSLTTELWTVSEKFLMKKDEADWLRKKQRSGSLMSLQHVHSAGLAPPPEEPSRPSDSYSLRSLPVHTMRDTREKNGRGLHMSDEEGEVFDNRWLKELSATPRRESLAPGQRLSELRWRNSLCPPHLKSSYPAETQFAPTVDEEDIKCVTASNSNTRQQRKEVGITAYKKPGPPTPSKQAGRLSATDSELRESLRVEGDPQPLRKTSTPSRIRLLFRSSKTETVEGTPRSRRLSSIFRKK